MIKCEETTTSCGSSKISGDTAQKAQKSFSGGNEAHLIIFKKETSRTTLKASPRRLFPKKNQSSLNAKQTGTGRFQSKGGTRDNITGNETVAFPELRKISHTSFSVYCLLTTTTTTTQKKCQEEAAGKGKGEEGKKKKKGKKHTAAPCHEKSRQAK